MSHHFGIFGPAQFPLPFHYLAPFLVFLPLVSLPLSLRWLRFPSLSLRIWRSEEDVSAALTCQSTVGNKPEKKKKFGEQLECDGVIRKNVLRAKCAR